AGIVVDHRVARRGVDQQRRTPRATAHVRGEFVQVAGPPDFGALPGRVVAGTGQVRIVAVQPHAAAGGDAAQLQLQPGFAGQARLRGAQLGEHGGADAAGSDQSDGQRPPAVDGRLRADLWRAGQDGRWQYTDVHDGLQRGPVLV